MVTMAAVQIEEIAHRGLSSESSTISRGVEMKNSRPERRSANRCGLMGNALTAMLVGVVLTCLSPSAAQAAGTKQYKFTNTSGQHAHDLHIEFNATVEWDTGDATFSWQNPAGTFKDTNGSGSATVDLAQGLDGTGVAAGGNVILTFGYPGNRAPYVRKWWWTDSSSEAIPPVRWPRRKRIKRTATFAQVGKAGVEEGELSIELCGETAYTFTTDVAETPEEMATRLASEIESNFPIANAYVDEADSTEVLFTGGCFGDDAQVSDVVVTQQPSYASLQVTMEVSDIPTVSQWGLAALALLVLAAGTVILRRKRAFAK